MPNVAVTNVHGPPSPTARFRDHRQRVANRGLCVDADVATFVRDQDEPCRLVAVHGCGDQLEEHRPPRFRQGGASPRPEDHFGLREKTERSKQFTESSLIAVIAAREHQCVLDVLRGMWRGAATSDGTDELADPSILGPRIRELSISPEAIVVPSPDPVSLQEASSDEVSHDRLSGTGADADLQGELAQPLVGLPGERDQHHPVMREE